MFRHERVQLFFTIAKLTICTRIKKLYKLTFIMMSYKIKFRKNFHSGANQQFCNRKEGEIFSCLIYVKLPIKLLGFREFKSVR